VIGPRVSAQDRTVVAQPAAHVQRPHTVGYALARCKSDLASAKHRTDLAQYFWSLHILRSCCTGRSSGQSTGFSIGEMRPVSGMLYVSQSGRREMAMPTVTEFFDYDAFVAHPKPFLSAIIAGVLIGYWFCKITKQSKIDGLEERVKFRDDQIALKDNTIQTMSADRTNLEKAAMAPALTPPLPAKVEPTTPNGSDSRFAAANTQIMRTTEERLRNLLLSGTFKFVFNPSTGASKELTFLPNFDVGKGRNHNENRWRIVDGRLEILNSGGTVYSRFVLLDDNISLHHTNDPELPSIKGQYIKRI
jgi:hypothetical protein